MSFGASWGTAFYSGGGSTSLVPSLFPLAIAGRVYLLDDSREGGGAQNGDLPAQREQTDDRAEPSEATLSTQGFWRRSVESWHHGAGQDNYDRPESDQYRFATSAGIEPWTRYELRTLRGVTSALLSTNINLLLAVAAGRLYVTDGAMVRFTTDRVNWTAVTGTPGVAATSITSDGSTVYVAFGASGIYTIAPGATAAVSYATGTVSAVAYARGRLLAVETSGASPRVYNVTATGAVTGGNLLLTVPGATFEPGQWATEGTSAIYLAAFVGDKSRLWRTAVKQDGTALDVPLIAGQIPDGQTVRAIQDYLGSLMLIGTDDRVWVAEYDGAGNLAPLGNITSDVPVRAFEHQDRYVWYNRGAALLGRLNVAEDRDPRDDIFQPASAADLSAGGAGAVQSIATYDGLRVFTVSGRGVFTEAVTAVASGSLETGEIRFGIGDVKNVLYADVRHKPLAAGQSVALEVSADGGAWASVGSSAEVGSASKTFDLGQRRAEGVNLRLTLTGEVVVTGLTVRAIPAPPVGEMWRFHIRLFEKDTDLGGNAVHYDPVRERAYLRELRAAKTAVVVQHGAETFTGVIEQLTSWQDEGRAHGDGGVWTGRWNGVQEILVRVVG